MVMIISNMEKISKEMIKPSAPTPPHLQTHHLTLFDCQMPEIAIEIVLFYPHPNLTSLSTLKTSLSQTLSLFYPLAGRLSSSDRAVVDSNDHGVWFTQAQATADASSSLSRHVVSSSDMKLLVPPLDSSSLLAVQVTTFVPCGGLAVGCCLSHRIGDGHSTSAFITAWAATTCGRGADVPRPLFTAASLFPPPSDAGVRDVIAGFDRAVAAARTIGAVDSVKPTVTKRFVFDESAISTLRSSSSSVSLTRVQAVVALLWRCCLKAREKPHPHTRACIPVNMRGRGQPEELFTNLVYSIVPVLLDIDVQGDPAGAKSRVEEKVSGAITGIDAERIKRFRGGDEWMLVFEPSLEAWKECTGGHVVDQYTFTSWTRFPLYEADFAWGTPIFVGLVPSQEKRNIVLMARGGGSRRRGIEAWVTLEEEEMAKLEKDEELTAHASSSY